jgi:hypothetical protein
MVHGKSKLFWPVGRAAPGEPVAMSPLAMHNHCAININHVPNPNTFRLGDMSNGRRFTPNGVAL